MAFKNKKKFRLELKRIPEEHIYRDIVNIFQTVQGNTSCHEKCIKMLQDIFNKTECELFTEQFIKCLQVPLQIGEKNAKVEFTLDFAAKFCATFSQDVVDDADTDTEMHPFLLAIFNYAVKYCACDLPGVRYRICQFINKTLVFMGEQAELDDTLCDDILLAMLARLQDIKYKVRTQAVIALHRLQNPADPNDKVTKSYLFHLECDPSAPVRRAVINNLARSQKAFIPVALRIHDIDEKVRRDAYNFLSMYSSKFFKIQQRIQLLKSGLTDRSNYVKKCVSEVLLPKWFVYFERSYFEFIKGITLDATVEDLKQSVEVAEMLLDVFFNKDPARDLINALPLTENKVLSIDRLNHESVTYWRCLVRFFYKQNIEGQEFLDDIIPELSHFCSYIQTYVYTERDKKRDQWEEIVHQSVLQQLFDMIKYFDLSDEVGRNNLLQLIMDLLLKENLFTDVIQTMVHILERLKPETKQRILELVELISDVTEPLQRTEVQLTEDERRRKDVKIRELRFKVNCLINDEETAVAEKNYIEAARLKTEITEHRAKLNELLSEPVPVQEVREKTNDETSLHKALDIIIATFQSPSIRKLTPELRVLQQNLILDLCTQSSVPPEIEAKALQCLAMCAYLDETLAISVMPKLFYRLMSYKLNVMFNEDVLRVSLSASIDLLLLYGLEKFPEAEEATNGRNNRTKRTLYDNTQDADEDDDDDEIRNTQDLPNLSLGTSANEIISCIISFIDDDNAKIRTLAADGLCRLLVCEKLKSTDVLTRLIILWFNPATENDTEMRQVIGATFNHFAQHTSGAQEEIVKAFLPVINTILDAPVNSPLTQVDVDAVVNFLLIHTQPGFSSVDSTVNVHNHLAIMICEEIFKGNRECGNYIKCLPTLKISDDDQSLKKDLHNLCVQITSQIKSKAYLRYIQKFIARILSNDSSNAAEEENESETTKETNPEKPTIETIEMPNTRRSTSTPVVLIERCDTIPNIHSKEKENVRTPVNISVRSNMSTRSSTRASSCRLKMLMDNEDNVSIADSSASSTPSNRERLSQNIVISTSESEDAESSSDSEVEMQEPKKLVVRRNLRRRNINLEVMN